MSSSAVLLPSTTGFANVVGSAVKADGWYGNTSGLHTIAIYVQNLLGRVYIDASLADNPGPLDWFSIPLFDDTVYIEYPQNPAAPTGVPQGAVIGDTGVNSFTFKANILWLRARLDRSYLPDPMQTETEIAMLGIVRKILLSR